MSIDQVPAQVADTTDNSKYAHLGGNLVADSTQQSNLKIDNGERNAALVNSGVLPDTRLHEKESWASRDNAGGTGNHAGHEFHHQGHQDPGGHHERPEERLHRTEIKNLSPDERAKFKAEGPAAHEYRSEMAAWRSAGKTGPEPAKPDLPEHEKVAAKVKADREDIETKVRSGMSPEQLATIDREKAQIRQELKSGDRKDVHMTPELIEYNKQMAMGTRHFLRQNSAPAG
jgi:hypothetical protein